MFSTGNLEFENIRCFSPYGAFVNWMFPWGSPDGEKRGGIDDFMKPKDFKYLKGMSKGKEKKTEGIAYKC